MTTELSITTVDAESLQPNPWNTNQITDPVNEEKLRESLRRFGVFKPILVREIDGGVLEIIGGEHRWKAALQLGHQTVPVLNLGPIDDQRAKELGLVDNGRYGEDDPFALSALIKELGSDVFDFMPLADLDLSKIASLSANALEDLDQLDRAELPSLENVPTSPTGQIVRFKVPVEDASWVKQLIDQEKKTQGFKDEDSLTNAGHALVSLLKRLKGGA